MKCFCACRVSVLYAPGVFSQRAAPAAWISTCSKKLRVVLKRAQYFITCNGKMAAGIRFREESVRRTLTMLEAKELPGEAGEQLSLFPAETERKLAP